MNGSEGRRDHVEEYEYGLRVREVQSGRLRVRVEGERRGRRLPVRPFVRVPGAVRVQRLRVLQQEELRLRALQG